MISTQCSEVLNEKTTNLLLFSCIIMCDQFSSVEYPQILRRAVWHRISFEWLSFVLCFSLFSFCFSVFAENKRAECWVSAWCTRHNHSEKWELRDDPVPPVLVPWLGRLVRRFWEPGQIWGTFAKSFVLGYSRSEPLSSAESQDD